MKMAITAGKALAITLATLLNHPTSFTDIARMHIAEFRLRK